jgi:hypothetical protein
MDDTDCLRILQVAYEVLRIRTTYCVIRNAQYIDVSMYVCKWIQGERRYGGVGASS